LWIHVHVAAAVYWSTCLASRPTWCQHEFQFVQSGGRVRISGKCISATFCCIWGGGGLLTTVKWNGTDTNTKYKNSYKHVYIYSIFFLSNFNLQKNINIMKHVSSHTVQVHVHSKIH
jgi:hypothetical protein